MAKIPKKLKQEIKRRAFGCCEYCQIPANYSPSPFPAEHIDPSSKGGTDASDNLAFACNGCNWFKGNKTEGIDPETGQTVPLFNPRQQLWFDHFDWEENSLNVIGLTPIGRATIVVLKLNREGVINLRFALMAIGKHPPSHLEK